MAREEADRLQKIIDDKESRKSKIHIDIKKLEQEKAEKQYTLSQEIEIARIEASKKLEEQVKEEAKTKIELFQNALEEDLKRLSQLKEEKLEEFKEFEEQVMTRMEGLKSLEQAAIDARMRQYEESDEEGFYRIKLSDRDVVEIDEILSVIEMFRNPTPLRKAIFDIYYRKPLKDLRQRLTKGEKICGIYKITHIETGKCYIGQSVDISNRWLQHCKRGFGVDQVTNNKLYPEMYKYGIHNFRYEIIEEVERENLTGREKYWSDYFGAKVFGYTMKA
jgi:hypothetical protein